ncbi:hypothetical protein [Gluconobacter sp. DsW_056]|uniref:hypothetical protein n=1 Tax=Gluconobacter sp. DsW_056 TaxID=1511209 RepID=UPI00117BDBA1|nr:hypothetical protein [Gluconobacter sp. DsW_056]
MDSKSHQAVLDGCQRGPRSMPACQIIAPMGRRCARDPIEARELHLNKHLGSSSAQVTENVWIWQNVTFSGVAASGSFVPNAVYRGSPDNVGFRAAAINTSMSDM